MKVFYIILFFIISPVYLGAQTSGLQGWHLQDWAADGYYGVSLDKAYEFLAAKKLKNNPLIVAVLDDGIDTLHEDLRDVLWVNKKEIGDNGIDDDGNGYVDDVFGWNFLGSRDGRNVASNSSEWIRVYWRYKEKYEGTPVDTLKMTLAEKYEFAMWVKARSGVVGKGMKEEELDNLQSFLQNVLYSDSVLSPNFAGGEFTELQLKDFKPGNKLQKSTREFYLGLFKQFTGDDITNNFALSELKKYVLGEQRRASGDKVPPDDSRREITGDDDTKIDRLHYGNNDNSNGHLMHGTHLAGIIGANRTNNRGMRGISDNVQIMMVRTSAEGDEYDKDIAAGIRYAVDNGARVVNMSFGKSLSPDKKFIDDAARYALSKDVLLVQAAGNSKRNINAFDNFPNPRYLHSDSMAPNWITVGASDTIGNAAAFSNYGSKVVDIFAPGVAIYSTVPNGNKYQSWEGTSMAAPVVSGVAALIRSYFPTLSAPQVKKILQQSVEVPANPTQQPGTTEKVRMDQLCTSGGIVNAYKAVQLAYHVSR